MTDYSIQDLLLLVSKNTDEMPEIEEDSTDGEETMEMMQDDPSDDKLKTLKIYVRSQAVTAAIKVDEETIFQIQRDKMSDSDDKMSDIGEIYFSDDTSEEESTSSEENQDHVLYRPFFKAIREKNWKGVEDFIKDNRQALTAKINVYYEDTVFHILARDLDAPSWLLENLAFMAPPESLEELKTLEGQTALFAAALYGNTKAAKALVQRNGNLPNVRNYKNYLPIHRAAQRGHKEIIEYLISVTDTPMDDRKDVEMLQDLIDSGLYSITLKLLKKYPNLARAKYDRGRILGKLAKKPQAFESGSHLGFWKRLIYKWIPVQKEHTQPQSGSILRQISNAFGSLSQKLHIMFWNALILLVPGIRCLHDTKLTHLQTLEIVKMMCHEEVIWSHFKAYHFLNKPIFTAARFGIWELVKEILSAYFYAYTFWDEDDHNLLEIVILHRQERVFSLLNKMNIFDNEWKAPYKQEEEPDTLHVAAKFVPSSQIPGAALQMQKELQWFKTIESYVHPSIREHRNSDKKTPKEVFTEEHKNLVKEGEKWMKETAQSFAFVAALIITVVFATAFTIPGGNNTKGIPIFLQKPSFIVFIISDALALFSSIASVLMFLGILTSRYSEDDFLKSLPNKLIIGLITLFFSIASMTVAFGASIYMILSHLSKWVIIPIVLLGCFPVTLFAWLQFPLLIEIFLSTYKPNIFRALHINKDQMKEIKEVKELKEQSMLKGAKPLPDDEIGEMVSGKSELLKRIDRQEQIIQDQQKAIQQMQESHAQLLNRIKTSSTAMVESSHSASI